MFMAALNLALMAAVLSIVINVAKFKPQKLLDVGGPVPRTW